MKLMERIKNYLKKVWEVPPPTPDYLKRRENFTGVEHGTTYENATFDVRKTKVTGFGFTSITTWHGGKITAGDFCCAKWEGGEFAGRFLQCGWSGGMGKARGLPGYNDGWMGGVFSGDTLHCTYWHDGLFVGKTLECSEWRKGEFKGERLTCKTFASGSCSAHDLETMLQLTYLYFTNLRSDDEAFQSYLTRNKAMLANVESDPMTAFRDMLTQSGVTCTIRASRGEDILAACGMLAGQKQ